MLSSRVQQERVGYIFATKTLRLPYETHRHIVLLSKKRIAQLVYAWWDTMFFLSEHTFAPRWVCGSIYLANEGMGC